jgi:hypothetical protein
MGLTYDVLTSGFYDRLGYRTVGIIEDCPAGTATRWYCKDLRQLGLDGGGTGDH